MIQFNSADIVKTVNGIKYVACMFKCTKRKGWSIQWVRANKVGEL